MITPAAFQVLIGLLCLNHLFPSLVQAAKPQPAQSVKCNTLTNVTRGTIITTKPLGDSRWCGQSTRHFLAVAHNKLFYLECPEEYPNHARGSIFYPDQAADNYQLFYPYDMCDVKWGTFNTKDRSNILANMLEGRLVPYDAVGCNPQHYIAYLTYGKIPLNSNLWVHPSCPVFQPFNDKTRINNTFKLKDQQFYYEWPSTEKAGCLTPISRTRYQVPKSPPKRSSSWGWFGRALSGKKSPNRIGGVNKKGGASGGHGGGGGGHGSSSGGHGGEGSVGGEGGRGTGTGSGTVPYYAARGNGGHTSAGSRPQPILGFKVPTVDWSGFGLGYGYGYGNGYALGHRK